MKKIIFALLGSFVASVAFASAAGKSIACWSQDFGKRPIVITFNGETATFSFAGKACELTSVPYKPVSSYYQGWIRFANKNPYNKKTRKTACTDIMSAVFNQQEKNPSSFPDMDWISVSTQVQKNGDGQLQLGWQNLWDPGAGGTVKTMMGCRPNQQ